MADFRPLCLKCGTRFSCTKNSFDIKYGFSQYQSGDKWTCPECGIEIVTGFGTPRETSIEYRNKCLTVANSQ